MEKKKYGLFVAITMIIGIVIGSGIFFKSDDILKYTNGSIGLGIIVFIIGAVSIIFGSLSMGELASRNDEPGGIISYASKFCNKPLSSAFGWFNTFVYYPTLVSVVSWVAGVYICMLFGIESTLENQVIIGVSSMLIIFIMNFLSAKLAGWFQGAATIIKLLPLIFIGIAGLIFGDPMSSVTLDSQTLQSTSWLLALSPMAFAFDGWFISTTISHEIKNSKKNLPIALIISPIIILVVYIAYFVGITSYIGPETVISLGDSHVQYAAQSLIGDWGAKAVVTFVVISVLGTLNGLTLGGMRMPYSLAVKNMFPKSEKISKINEKLGISVFSAFISLILSSLWYVIHYLTMKYDLLSGSDVSEIAIVTNYMLFIFLYVAVIKLAKKGEIKGIARGYIVPILAIVGSLIIFFGSMGMANFWYYIIFSLVVISIGYLYTHIKMKKQPKK